RLRPLVEDDVALVVELGLVDGVGDAGESVGLEPERSRQERRGREIDEQRAVLLGVGVGPAALFLDELVEEPVGCVRRALEHEVLEEVREAGLAALLVGGADPHPDRDRRLRRPVVDNAEDAEPVRKARLHGSQGRSRRGGAGRTRAARQGAARRGARGGAGGAPGRGGRVDGAASGRVHNARRCYPAGMAGPPFAWLDPLVARRPFEGRAARRYAIAERPAFGDLDERLLDRLAPELARAACFLDVGSGTGILAAKVAARWPRLRVTAVEPSARFTRDAAPLPPLRARADALPLSDACVDVAVCLSSLRHPRDRGAALAELRRVLRPGGSAWIVELDPDADRSRSDRHRRAVAS